MAKKEKISAEKKINETVSEQPSEKKRKFNPTKKMLAIIASVCVVLIAAAIAVPLGIIYGTKKRTVPEPYFDNFNAETDDSIRVRWNKIREADAYGYVYCFGDPEETDESKYVLGRTPNTLVSFPRHKGTVAFKVKAEITGENTEYSDWITLDVPARKLEKPIVTVTDKLSVSWVPSTFKRELKTYDVNSYAYNVLVDGISIMGDDRTVSTKSADILDFVYNALGYEEKIAEYNLNGIWTDITLTIKVKALAYESFLGTPLTSPPYDVLTEVYEDSDYYEVTITITEEFYKGLK